jgi:hypothetical protein
VLENNDHIYDAARLSKESLANVRGLEERLKEETGEEIVLIAYSEKQKQQHS